MLTINFDNMTYPVTVDGLHTVSTFRRLPSWCEQSSWSATSLVAVYFVLLSCLSRFSGFLMSLLQISSPCRPVLPFSHPSSCPPRWQIFSTYGQVQKIHIYERDGKTVALVQVKDVETDVFVRVKGGWKEMVQQHVPWPSIPGEGCCTTVECILRQICQAGTT